VRSLEVLRTQARLHQMYLLVQLELCEHVSGTSGRSVNYGTTIISRDGPSARSPRHWYCLDM